MINKNNLQTAEACINSLNGGNSNVKVKYVKQDKGLMEKSVKEEKVILVEDNRQVLLG